MITVTESHWCIIRGGEYRCGCGLKFLFARDLVAHVGKARQERAA